MLTRNDFKPAVITVMLTTISAAAVSLVNGCSGGETPPSVGVFIKNPGEDYIKLESYEYEKSRRGYFKGTNIYNYPDEIETSVIPHGVAPFINDLPLLKEGGKVVFYSIDLDYSKLYLGSYLEDVHIADPRIRDYVYVGLSGKIMSEKPLEVQKIRDDTYFIEFQENDLLTGSHYINNGSNNSRAWLFSHRSPSLFNLIGNWEVLNIPTDWEEVPGRKYSGGKLMWKIRQKITGATQPESSFTFMDYPAAKRNGSLVFHVPSTDIGFVEFLKKRNFKADSLEITVKYDATNDQMVAALLGQNVIFKRRW